jgi:hypothetical protein
MLNQNLKINGIQLETSVSSKQSFDAGTSSYRKMQKETYNKLPSKVSEEEIEEEQKTE